MNKITNLIKKSSLLLMAAGFSVAISSCEGDEGSVGPVGPKGETGATGAQGEQGEQGESALRKAGYYEGTIKGTRQDGTAFEESFKYEYSDEYLETLGYARTAVAGITIKRFRDGNYSEGNPSLKINGYFANDGTGNKTLEVMEFNFYFSKELSATKYFQFDAHHNNSERSADIPSTFELTNYVYDESTGKLSFDFKYDSDGNYNSTGNPVTITGKFNSGDSKFYQEIVNRKGN